MTHRLAMVDVGVQGPFEVLTHRPHVSAVQRRIEATVREVVEKWGLVGRPRCTLRSNAVRPIDIRIQGRSIDYPWDSLRRLRSSGWEGADAAAIADAAVELVEETLQQNPSAFITARQAADYMGWQETDGRAGYPLDVLRSLLWLGVPIGERGYVRGRIEKAREVNARADELVEVLFADLRGHVRIHADPALLSAISKVPAEQVDARCDDCLPDARRQLEELEHLLYVTSGVQLPDVSWAADPRLPEGMISLEVNSHRHPPVPMDPGAMTPVLARLIQASAHRLLGLQDVESQLAELQVTCPELVQAAITRVTSTQLTRTLREMVRDSLSIRDLRAILDRLLSFETISVDAGQAHICDLRLPIIREAAIPPSVQYLDFIRHGLKHRLVHDHVEGHLILTLDPATQTRIENALTREQWPGERSLRALKDAVGEQMERWGGGLPATVLVRPTIRWHVRRMLAVEFPEVAVLATSEVPVDVVLRSTVLGSTDRSAPAEGPISKKVSDRPSPTGSRHSG